MSLETKLEMLQAGESHSRRAFAAFCRSFRAQLLVVVLVIVIPAITLGIYANIRDRTKEKDRLRERTLAIAQLAATREQDFIDDTRQILATLTQFPFLLMATNEPFARNHLVNLRKLSPDYSNFGLIETNGVLFCSAETNAGINLADRAYFQKTIQSGKFSAGTFQVSRTTDEKTLNFGYPVLDDQGNLVRVLYASLKLTPLLESIADVHAPPGGATTLIDRYGFALARNPNRESWSGRSMAKSLPLTQILGSNEEVFESRMPGQVSKLYAVTPLSDGQSNCMYVVVEAPLYVLYAEANAALLRNLLTLSAIALLTWLLVHALARSLFFQPIAKLSATANQLATGEMSARVGTINGPSELVQLGGALDAMSERVEKKTSDLLATNAMLRDEIAQRQKAEQVAKETEEKRRQIEVQFLRSQRMETIGALAGGIAHDLNNALVPVVMGAQMLREEPLDSDDRNKLLNLLTTGAGRCSEMVKQILAFARGKQGKAGTLAVRHLVIEMGNLVRETFPKSITLQVRAPSDIWTISGDPTEIHQVLLNLCVNARDAMPMGGQLRLITENTTVQERLPEMPPEITPGPFVVITVEDTGSGIPPDLQSRIFEPFFTTKTQDKGTGLGLSTVLNIVRRHNGFIRIKSEVGKGTQFKIFLPATTSSQTAGATSETAPALPVGNGEMILLVDDEQMVLELGKTTLQNYGYRVLAATNGMEAIARFEVHKDQISLVITDTDMPFLDGASAAMAIRKTSPNVPIIMASATKLDTMFLSRQAVSFANTLSKPYDVEQLLRSVANALAKV